MSKRILVVEDQEDNMQIIRDLLTSADYEMIEAENGEEALAAVAKQRPDLILMDIQLPIMDGYEATRRIKADPALQSIPIIAVTSYALSGDEAESAGGRLRRLRAEALQPASAPGEDSSVSAVARYLHRRPRAESGMPFVCRGEKDGTKATSHQLFNCYEQANGDSSSTNRTRRCGRHALSTAGILASLQLSRARSCSLCEK